MTLTALAPTAVPATLAQEKLNFTAEGAPPPGKVSSVVHAPADPIPPADNDAVLRVRGTIKLKPRSRARHR